MKRMLALLFAVMVFLTFAACSNAPEKEATDPAASGSDIESGFGTQNGFNDSPSRYINSLAVLQAIWDNYGENEKFSVLGGNHGSMEEGVPGALDLSNAEDATSLLRIPRENVGELESAASMVHMLNTNTFTSAVFQTTKDVKALSEIMVNAVNSTQFVCGAPEVMVTLKVDHYLIMAFGTEDLVRVFKTKALALEGVSLIHEGPVVYSGGSGGLPIVG